MKINATLFTLAISIGSFIYPQFTHAQSISTPNPISGLGRFHGVNTNGQAVGHTLGGDEPEGLFLDTGSKTATKIKIQNGISVKAFGIEDSGQAVGSYHEFDPVTHAATGKTHGFLYVQGKTPTNVDYPGANITVARGINNAKTIVGFYRDTSGTPHHHGFILSNGKYTSVDVKGASDTYLTGISNQGVAVGYYTGSTPDSEGHYHQHGFTYDQNGTVTTFDASVFGVVAADTFAYGINSFGFIVGSYINDSDGITHGYIDIPFPLLPPPFNNFYLPLDLPGAPPGVGSFAQGINDNNLVTLFGALSFLTTVSSQ